MLSDKPLVDFDADVLLSYINADVARVEHIEGLFQDSSIQIVTSILSIAEVAFAKVEQDGKSLSQDAEEKINKLWGINSPVETVEFYELIAEDAKKLMRLGLSKGWRLKAPDAIHLATADRLGVTEFNSYDEGYRKYEDHTNTKFKIRAPQAKQSVLIVPEET